MKAFARAGLLTAFIWLQLSGLSFGKQVYLKDGAELECQSFWRSHGQIVVKVNRDVVLQFASSEVDMAKTFPHAKRKGHLRKNPASHASPSPAAAATGAETADQRQANKVQQETAAMQAKSAAELAGASRTAKTATVPGRDGTSAKPPVSTPAVPQPPAAADGKEAAALETADATSAGSNQPLTKEELNRRARENAEMMAQALKNHDAELMKKALDGQKRLVEEQQKQLGKQPQGGPAGQKPEPPWFKYFLMMIVSMLIMIIAMWVIFQRAGQSAWKSVIPFYNMYILMVIAGKPGWWFALTLIPVVGAAFFLMAMLSLAEKFGRSAVFGVGLAFLPMFFFPIIAFGGSKYESGQAEMNFTFAEPPES